MSVPISAENIRRMFAGLLIACREAPETLAIVASIVNDENLTDQQQISLIQAARWAGFVVTMPRTRSQFVVSTQKMRAPTRGEV